MLSLQGGQPAVQSTPVRSCVLLFFVFGSGWCMIAARHPQVRPEFVMFGNKMRLNLDIQGDDMFSDREVSPQQPPAWTIK